MTSTMFRKGGEFISSRETMQRTFALLEEKYARDLRNNAFDENTTFRNVPGISIWEQDGTDGEPDVKVELTESTSMIGIELSAGDRSVLKIKYDCDKDKQDNGEMSITRTLPGLS